MRCPSGRGSPGSNARIGGNRLWIGACGVAFTHSVGPHFGCSAKRRWLSRPEDRKAVAEKHTHTQRERKNDGRRERLMPAADGTFLPNESKAVAAASGDTGCVWSINDISPIWRRTPSQELMRKVCSLISPKRMNSWTAPSVVGP